MPKRHSLPQIAPWVLLSAAPLAAFIMLRSYPALDVEANSPEGHFYIVSVVSLINVVLGIVASIAALRANSGRVLLLALAFVSMAAIFAVHGLSTPGFLVGEQFDELTGISSRLSTLVAATFLALSAIDLPRAIERALVRWRARVLTAWLAILAVYASALMKPSVIPRWVIEERAFAEVSLVLVIAMATFTAYRYFTGYRRSGLAMYGAVALGSALIVQAQIGMHFGLKYHGTWWLYHVELLIGFSAIMWGLFVEYARGNSPVLAIEGLSLRDPIQQIQAGYTESIQSLAAALEAKDGYTLGHGQRVAALCVLIGERMGLAPGRIRGLYQGALLHDVGKIGVPDRILHKPGRLTDDEFGVIKEHPERGQSMLAAAFDSDVELAVIRHHHERFSGGGYPDGLAGSDIPLEARIAAVADVYDALRSARAYRPTWDPKRAQEHIREGAGVHFDPDCVEAFFAVVDRWEAEYSEDSAPYLEHRPLHRAA